MLKFKASFDDGCRLDMRVADLLDKYGIEDAIFYIPSKWKLVNQEHGDEPLAYYEFAALAKRFKIGSHTMTHPMLTRIPDDQIYDEVVQSKKDMEYMLKADVEDFCYPRGYANDEIRDLVRKHYKRARNTLVGNLDPPEDPVWETPTVHVAGVRRREYEGSAWWNVANRYLNIARKRSLQGDDVIYHLWGHSWEIDRYDHWTEFENLLQKISHVREEVPA